MVLLVAAISACNKPADYGVIEGAEGHSDVDSDAADAQPSCVKQHPRTSAVAEASLISEVIRDCDSDSGACQASTECSGSVDNRVCDRTNSSLPRPRSASRPLPASRRDCMACART